MNRLQLNDLLRSAAIEPDQVLVLRHRPNEPALRQVLPWLAASEPAVFNAFQQSNWPRAEAAMAKAAYVVSAIGLAPKEAVFAGLYRVAGDRPLTYDEFWAIPENVRLKGLGMPGLTEPGSSIRWFDLQPVTEFYPDWKGKLVLDWPGLERSWFRWAANNSFEVRAVLAESAFEPEMPSWDRLVVSHEQLRALLPSWRDALRQWRGVYYICDLSDGRGYVGSAYGADNLLGRWETYGATGHGGNKRLRDRDPANLRFSILQLTAPDLPTEDVIQIEAKWKERLHTRAIGLNEN